MDALETRILTLTAEDKWEFRSDEATKREWIAGYAARFNSPSRDLGGFTEIIAPGAFADSLKGGRDVRCLVSHDPDRLLSRTANQTLVLTENRNGLRFESIVPSTTYGNDLLELLRLGTMSQCSFGFRVPDGGDDLAVSADGKVVRTLKRIDLYEVSIVATPAYEATSVSLRVAPDFIQRVEAFRLTVETQASPDLAARRLQLRRAELANLN